MNNTVKRGVYTMGRIDGINYSVKRVNNIGDIVGKTFSTVEYNEENEKLEFTCTDGTYYELYHEQDCCELIYLAETIGDLDDLVGSPILLAEERKSYAPFLHDSYGEIDVQWTFYELATIKGSVTLRWYGDSGESGCYSADVELYLVAPRG